MTAIRTIRTLYRVWDHRRLGHALVVDPGAVTCQTCDLCTCGQPFSAPPCSRNPATGKGGHITAGGVGAA